MIARVCIVMLLCLQVAGAGVTRWQPAYHFRVNPLYLPLGGIGLALDRDVSPEHEMGVNVGFINLFEVNYQGAGLRWTRNFNPKRGERRYYMHGTTGLGHLGFSRSDGSSSGGPLYWVQGMAGLENTGWLNMRIRNGVGLAHAWPDDPEGNQPWLEDLIRGTNVRVEITVEFVKAGSRTATKPWQPRVKRGPRIQPRP